MSERRSHYELAFESLLNRRGTPFVAVEDVRHFVQGRLGAKAFDYIVYPSGGPPHLIDVKGRKISAGLEKEDARSNNWITRGDYEGMSAWQGAFGPDYVTAFVFAFWLTGADRIDTGVSNTEAKAQAVESFAGRRYSYWLVTLEEYSRHQKQRSRRWDTLSVPTEDFRRVSKRLQMAWPAAPC